MQLWEAEWDQKPGLLVKVVLEGGGAESGVLGFLPRIPSTRAPRPGIGGFPYLIIVSERLLWERLHCSPARVHAHVHDHEDVHARSGRSSEQRAGPSEPHRCRLY